MSVQTSLPRPATKSVGAAFVDIVLTLVILVVTFLAFLIAPLLALAVAYLVYAVVRPRSNKKRATATTAGGSGATAAPAGRPTAAHGFGAGAAS